MKLRIPRLYAFAQPAGSACSQSRFRWPATLICWVSFCFCYLGVANTPVFANGEASEDDQASKLGAKIYATQCASCHGAKGEGTDEHFSDPLRGVMGIEELTEYINDTMPEEDPDSCVGEEAEQVAQYIFEAFYSEAAVRRATTARLELSRLTVRQYQESIADLIGSFGDPLWISDEHGLAAIYFGSRGWRENRKLAEQIDPVIDFGDAVPHHDPTGEYKTLKKEEGGKPDQNLMSAGFSVYWSGGIVPPTTGTYEIIVESKNGFELKLNDPENPLIDRSVSSGEETEHRAKIDLLGGRLYSIRLHLFCGPNTKPSIRLLWKPPGQPVSVVPQSALVRYGGQEVMVVNTTFPADDASAGYERGVSVSEQWETATTDGAIEVANWLVDRIWKFAKTKPNQPNTIERIKSFGYEFVGRAFGTKLTDEEKAFYVDQHFEQDITLNDQIKRMVILTLKSPRFLYPSIETREPAFERARRMALVMWDSVPDKQLWEATNKGKLNKPADTVGQLYRMVEDPRSKQKLHAFIEHWLKAEEASSISKDKELYPGFDEQLLADLKSSLELYLHEVLWNEKSDYRQLFLADSLYVNRRIADYYEIDAELTGDGFQKVALSPERHAGVLTHPFMMSGLAYHRTSSPIHRGVFVAKQVLGRQLRQPPSNIEPLTEEFDPKMTTRERVEHQTKETACMSCHTVINPLGFSLENFDAVGRFRSLEKDRPVNVSGVYKTPEGEEVELNGARDLANFLANSEMAQRNFVRQLFNHYAKQSIDAFGPEQLDQLYQKFANSNFNVKQLLVSIGEVIVNHELKSE